MLLWIKIQQSLFDSWCPSRPSRKWKDLAIPPHVGLRIVRVESRVLHSGVTVLKQVFVLCLMRAVSNTTEMLSSLRVTEEKGWWDKRLLCNPHCCEWIKHDVCPPLVFFFFFFSWPGRLLVLQRRWFKLICWDFKSKHRLLCFQGYHCPPKDVILCTKKCNNCAVKPYQFFFPLFNHRKRFIGYKKFCFPFVARKEDSAKFLKGGCHKTCSINIHKIRQS